MGRLRLLGVGIVLALCVLTFGLVPAAAENPGKPSPPGQEKTPPGQAAKAEQADEKEKPEKATPPGQLDKGTTEPAPSADQAAQADDGKAAPDAEAPSSHSKPSKQADEPKPEAPHKEHKEHVHKPAKNEPARGNSSVAHTHVIICHRTGSTKNPYVVINISMSAWLHGHTTHPPLNGHHDILLKQGAAPGEKLPRSACGHTEEPNTPKPPPADDPSTPKQTPKDTPKDTPNETPKPAGKPADPAVPGPAPAGTVVPPARPVRPAGIPAVGDAAVAGEVEVLSASELPFTGLPLWLAVFGGCLLLGTGLAIRKASWAPEDSQVDPARPTRGN